MAENTSPSGIALSNGTPAGSGTPDDLSFVGFFRFALEYPGEEQFAAFVRPEFLSGLQALWADLLPGQPWSDVELPESLEDLQADYIGLFDAGAPHAVCPLSESHYVKNAPASSVLLENKLFFAHFGFGHREGREAPDHLLVQLEFLACLEYLLHQVPESEKDGLERARSEYLDRHVLHWLPEAIGALSHTTPTIYLPLLRLLNACLRD